MAIVGAVTWNCGNNAQTSSKIEQLTFQAINRVRTENGLSELSWDEGLANLARSHSDDMVKNHFCGHQRSAGYPDLSAGMGENCYCQIPYLPPFDSPSGVANYAVNGWMQSPGHRANILRPSYYATGIGVVFYGGDCYITEVFQE